MSRKYHQEIRAYPKCAILDLCKMFWESGCLEEPFVACDWSFNLRDQFQTPDLHIFESWISNYVTNWASCDTLCNHTVGAYLEKYPGAVTSLHEWATSPNRWARRAAAVSLIIPARKGLLQQEVLTIADRLLIDDDDLVQKGYR